MRSALCYYVQLVYGWTCVNLMKLTATICDNAKVLNSSFTIFTMRILWEVILQCDVVSNSHPNTSRIWS